MLQSVALPFLLLATIAHSNGYLVGGGASPMIVIGENGTRSEAFPEINNTEVGDLKYNVKAGDGSAYTIEECFVAVCQSDSVRDMLIKACQKSGKYGSCSNLNYARTLYHTGSTPTFSVTHQFSYDTAHLDVVYTKANAYNTKWNNELNVPQSETFEHDVTKTAQQTWTNTVTSKVSSSISVKETAGLPEVVQEEITATVTAELDTSSTKSVSKTTTQTWKESQTINVPKNQCIEGCMIETMGEVKLPYTIAGKIKSDYTDPKYKETFAAQCCYLRPGGASHCAFLDGSGPSGWNALLSPAQAASQNLKQCAGFGVSGSDASFASRGMFSGGVGFNVSIATVKCGHECTIP